MHQDEEQAQREEEQRQREERERLLNTEYERGAYFTAEQHDRMYASLEEADIEARLVPGGNNNLYYCIQRWAQTEGNDRLYGRTVEQLQAEVSDRLLERCKQRAREEELTRAVGNVDDYLHRVRTSRGDIIEGDWASMRPWPPFLERRSPGLLHRK